MLGPDVRRPAPVRAQPRRAQRLDPPARRADDPGAPGRDPPVRARGARAGARPAHGGRRATRRATPRADHRRATRSTGSRNMAAYNPNGAEPLGRHGPRRGLPVLGRAGSATTATPSSPPATATASSAASTSRSAATSCSEIVKAADAGRADPHARSSPASPAPTQRPALPGPRAPEQLTMQKQAPSIGRILIAVGFTLSCFGLILFLWIAFGGPIPLKPAELPDHRLLPGGDPARARVRRADRRRLRRQGQGDRARAARQARRTARTRPRR